MRLSEDEYAALWWTQIAESRQSAPAPGWTPDRVETLTRLWNDGLTASVIAARLGGITSSAVIGKTQRLGLAPRRTGRRRQKPACMFRIERPRIQPKVPTLLHAMPKQTSILVKPGPSCSLAAVLALTARSCRWPSGDPRMAGFHFCGRAKAAHVPYCDHHASLATIHRRRKRKHPETNDTRAGAEI